MKGLDNLEYINVVKKETIAYISLNRAPVNALSSKVIEEIGGAFKKLEQENDIRVIILYGEGKFFSAGADIKEFTSYTEGKELENLARKAQQTFNYIEQFPKPVIAVIHGAALGGGLELAMACHMRIVGEKAKLGLPELQLGLIPGFGGTMRLPAYVGSAKAMEMMLTSEPVIGKEAVQWGLANVAYPEEQLMDKARELALKIAKKSPLSIKAVIEQMKFFRTEAFRQGLEKEANFFGTLFASNDGKEGIQAFLEKREPIFKGN